MTTYENCMNEVRQKAFELGGLEDGSYHLEEDELEEVVKLALSQQENIPPEPVAIANKGEHAFWVRWTDAGKSLRGPGIKLYSAPIAQTK